MSNGRRLRRGQRHHVHRRTGTDDLYAVNVGWAATNDDIEAVKKGTHDAVIDQLGNRRTGGVVWSIADGDDAEALLTLLFDGASPHFADHLRRVRGLLREKGGHVVAARAPGRP